MCLWLEVNQKLEVYRGIADDAEHVYRSWQCRLIPREGRSS